AARWPRPACRRNGTRSSGCGARRSCRPSPATGCTSRWPSWTSTPPAAPGSCTRAGPYPGPRADGRPRTAGVHRQRRHPMASRRTAVSVLAASALVLTACSGDGSDGGGGAATPVEDGTLVTAVAGDPGNLDPHMTVLALTRYVGTYMYDQLILIDEEGELRPWLAESWQEEPGSVTFTLREGITCSDGSPLTASDVAANVDFVADPANQSPLLGLWVQPGVTTSADDAARTVTVTAGSPDPFLLQGLALLPIVCAAGMADRDSLAHSGNGTGMFTLEEAVPGERYTFQRRDDYAWGPDGASASDPGTPAT